MLDDAGNLKLVLCDNLEGGMRREVGGKFGLGKAYVHLWLFHVAVWWKPSQYCRLIILQLKINFF